MSKQLNTMVTITVRRFYLIVTEIPIYFVFFSKIG